MTLLPIEEKRKESVKELTSLYEISKTTSQANYIEKAVLKKVFLCTKIHFFKG